MAAYIDLYPSLKIPDRINVYSIEDDLFYKLFRFDKETFSFICDLISPKVERETRRSYAISTELQLAATLRYFATGEFQLDVGVALNVSQSTVGRCVHDVSAALDSLFDQFVRWPTASELHTNKIGFHGIAGFPNVIGAVDCTHIRIQKPKENEFQYVNRKNFHSLNVQTVCDAKYSFLNVEVNWPGSCHDSFILRQSTVWRHMEESQFHGFVLGESAYPLRPWLMTPLLHPTTVNEHRENKSR